MSLSKITVVLLLGMVIPMLSGAVGIALWTGGDSDATAKLSVRLASLEQPLFLWRLLIFGSLLLAWHPLIDKLGHLRGWPPARRQALQDARASIALWLLILELLLGQNIVGQAVRLVQ